MDALSWTMTIFMAMSLMDLIAAVIAFYIFYRIMRTFIKTGIFSLGLLSAGFLLMFASFVITAIFYANASYQAWEMQAHMPEWMRRMHHAMSGQMARMMPMHWPLMVDASGVIPIPWLGIRLMLVAAYSLLLVGYIIGRIEVSREYNDLAGNVSKNSGYDNRVFVILPLAPMLVGVNVLALATLLLTVLAILFVYKNAKPAVIAGFVLLLLSHLAEIMIAFSPSEALMLFSEALRPLALFSIAAGVSNDGKK